MHTNLTWKKGFFSNLYKIYSNGKQIGNLKDKSFSQSRIGVLDNTQNKTVGEINYNNWISKATITINDKTINWKYDNLWNTKWSIFSSEEFNIKYSGSSTGGQIETNIDDAVLLLSGLFVRNYYWQMTIAILAAVSGGLWTTMN